MAKYGEAAVLASMALQEKFRDGPREAWNAAVGKIFPHSHSSRIKGCPRDTFLAICELGLIKNVPAQPYTRSIKNKRYAVDAIAILRLDGSMCDREKELWRIVTADTGKASNMQMEIVATLWRKGLIC